MNNTLQEFPGDHSLTGGMLRRLRQERGWSAAMVVDVYNEIMEGNYSLSERGLYYLEAEDQPLRPVTRRAVLFALFGMGTYTLTSFSVVPGEIVLPLRDLQEVQYRLPHYWMQGVRPHSAEKTFQQLVLLIRHLEQTALYGQQKSQARELLCQYLIVYANLLRDFGEPLQALPLLQKAQVLSQELDQRLLRAEIAYFKGFCYLDLRDHYNDVVQRQQKTQLAARAFLQAHHFQRADRGEIPALRTAIFAEFGVTQAYLAETLDERKKAMKLIEAGARYASQKTEQRHPLFLAVDEEWCHIDRLEAWLAMQQAKHVLDGVRDLAPPSAQKRRYILLTILEAEAYLQQGHIEMSVAYFLSALSSGVISQTHFLRIQRSCDFMRQHPTYQRHLDAARLAASLFKCAHPDLFFS